MAIDGQWLGRGWYDRESTADQQWIWSTDVAEIRARGCDRISIIFLTTYSDFIKTPQRITVVIDGSVQSTHYCGLEYTKSASGATGRSQSA